ncbi:MAG TPA: 2-C-methyl-D-erythritol 2,4-cyclodiphosphate synthase [Candidatus Limnocylindrales bacterium]|nr:2-C-methyl-D-erythritol 2,4-cyclodiphosphate synthase [Candidatus Limnocylindrales bacterium]
MHDVAALAPRIGLGRDRHPFGPGAPLRLGGLEIPGAPRLHGHSDGDVVLHAVADALLGAAGLGDLGRLAPADDRTPRGVDSADLVGATLARLATAGWRPAGLDLVIVGARPRLATHLDAIRDRLAELLGVAPECVSTKASTGNLQGPEGEGRAIAAHVVATLEPMMPSDRPASSASSRSTTVSTSTASSSSSASPERPG